MRRLAFAVAAVMCSVFLISVPGQATFRGRNGRIAFGTDGGVVKTIKRDGSHLRRVVGNAADPAWSPDGTKIAFTRIHTSGSPGCSIEISNPDGTGIVDLGGSHQGCDFGPAFTPDGRRLLYVYDNAMGHQVIRRMTVHGGNRTRIRWIPAGLEVHPPVVSPDGRTIAFQLSKNDTRRALFTVRMNGTDLRQLTPFKVNVGTLVDWSPSGRHIIFTSYENDGPGNTMLVRPDGSGLTQLTHYDGHVGAGGAAFAPNGRWIVYRRQNDSTGRCAIWKMRPDGSNRIRVRPFGVCFGGLDWGAQTS